MAFMQVELTYDQKQYEVLLGKLYQLPCDSLWEDEDVIKAFFDEELIGKAELEIALEELKGKSIKSYELTFPEEVNWNAKWEESFTPVKIEEICFIHAGFHVKEEGFKHYIEIAPKMAFGTGHHETTYMMIEMMSQVDFNGKKVLDLGCGSGILSVFAAQLEAGMIDAIDIEEPSFENAREHMQMNNVEYKVYLGGVEDVPNTNYEVVLANINRGVLLKYEEEIQGLMTNNSILLMSGVLEQDATIVEEAYLKHFTIEERRQKGKWLCYKLKKRTF